VFITGQYKGREQESGNRTQMLRSLRSLNLYIDSG
jgi:hypothetical protein